VKSRISRARELMRRHWLLVIGENSHERDRAARPDASPAARESIAAFTSDVMRTSGARGLRRRPSIACLSSGVCRGLRHGGCIVAVVHIATLQFARRERMAELRASNRRSRLSFSGEGGHATGTGVRARERTGNRVIMDLDSAVQPASCERTTESEEFMNTRLLTMVLLLSATAVFADGTVKRTIVIKDGKVISQHEEATRTPALEACSTRQARLLESACGSDGGSPRPLRLPKDAGVLVSLIESGSPAEKAGIHVATSSSASTGRSGSSSTCAWSARKKEGDSVASK